VPDMDSTGIPVYGRQRVKRPLRVHPLSPAVVV
jgi:hypothetical protein